MYRQYENPNRLEAELQRLKEEYCIAVEKGADEDTLINLHFAIDDLEERVNHAWQDDEEQEVMQMVKKTYKIIVHFSTGENTVVAVSRYKGYAELLAKWIDDYYRLKDMKVIVTVRQKEKRKKTMPEAIYTARPLTDEEKIFAEKNHNLMYRYIRIHELDLEDWYDILIIPYLQAVKKYFTYEHLQKYKFEQIFFRTLDSARSNYWRAMNRKMRCPSGGIYSYENLVCKRERDDLTGLECAENMAYLANGICNESAENEVVGTEMLKEALKTLDAEEQMIIKKKLYGYSDEEIYKSMGISVKKYNQILDRLIKAVEEVMYDV